MTTKLSSRAILEEKVVAFARSISTLLRPPKSPNSQLYHSSVSTRTTQVELPFAGWIAGSKQQTDRNNNTGRSRWSFCSNSASMIPEVDKVSLSCSKMRRGKIAKGEHVMHR
eukprot:2519829-Amphidinium_carterae.1